MTIVSSTMSAARIIVTYREVVIFNISMTFEAYYDEFD
jgi:hypothetical protein